MINQASLNELLEKAISAMKTPSISIGIYDNGEIMYSNAGYRDIEHKQRPDENTMYAIGSASKAFTATALAMMAEDGVIDLDKPVKYYIKEFEMYDDYVTNHLTVRDILCHRCGLPRHEFMWYLNLAEYTLKDIMDRLKYLQPNKPFRSSFQYQNHMYMLAGYLIEKATGNKWDDYIKEKILNPLSMKDTCFDLPGYKAYPNKAIPYMIDESGFPTEMAFKDIYEEGSAGSINSTASDMLKWLVTNLNNGSYEGTQVILSNVMKECHKVQTVMNEPKAMEFEEISMQCYGLGWFIETYKGVQIWQHGGSIDGFISGVCVIPSANVCFVILTNHDGGTTATAIRHSICDMILGLDKTDWVTRIKEATDAVNEKQDQAISKLKSEAPKNRPTTNPVKEYAGIYENPAYGTYEIKCLNGKLMLEKGGFKIEFIHLFSNEFIMKIIGRNMDTTCRFDYNMKGDITKLLCDFEGVYPSPIIFNKRQEAVN